MKIKYKHKLLFLTIFTAILSMLFGLGAATINDIFPHYQGFQVFFGIKSAICGVVHLITLVNYYFCKD